MLNILFMVLFNVLYFQKGGYYSGLEKGVLI